MSRSITMHALLPALGLAVLLAAAPAARAGSSTSDDDFAGNWTLWRQKDPAKMGLRLEYRTAHSHWSSSFDIRREELRGLTDEQLETQVGNASFELARDAGSFHCTGWLNRGKGGGEFTFEPSREYAEDLRRMGYGRLSPEEQYGMAVQDVSRDYIHQLERMGYGHIDRNMLMGLAVQGVTLDYIRELGDMGYRNLPLSKLMALRVQGVTPEYIRAMRQAYPGIGAEKMIALRVQGVTPEYVRAMRDAGYTNLSVDELLAMRVQGVTPEYAREMNRRVAR